jgi:hypothetical protein
MVDGDVISDIWNGIMFAPNIEVDGDDKYAVVSYNYDEELKETIYFEIDEFADNGRKNYIKLGELFDGELNKLKFSSINILNETAETTLGISESAGVYKVAYNDETYALINYTEATGYNIFDLIKAPADQDVITKIFKENLKVENVTTPVESFNWTLADYDPGYYAFKQADKFKVIEIKNTPSYNLFNIFDTDLILLADGDIEISKLNVQISVYESDVDSGKGIYVVISNGKNNVGSNILYASKDEDEKYRYYVTLLNFDPEFWLNLTSYEVKFYQTDELEEELDDGHEDKVIEEVVTISLKETDDTRIINLSHAEYQLT